MAIGQVTFSREGLQPSPASTKSTISTACSDCVCCKLLCRSWRICLCEVCWCCSYNCCCIEMLVVDLGITWQFIATHWVVRQFSAKSGPPLVMTCTMSQPAQQCNWATRRDPQVDVGPRLPTTSTARTLASTMQLGRQERSTPSNTCVRCDSNLLPHCHCAKLVSAQTLLSDMSWRRPKKLP